METPVDEILPWQENPNSLEGSTDEPHSVQSVLQAVCGPISENQKSQFQELSEKLVQHLMPSKDLIFLTHYFVTHWLLRLGAGPGWFITLLRDRGYINLRTGEIRDTVTLPGGYNEAAFCLGLKRVKTIWEWLKNNEVAKFVQEIGREVGNRGGLPHSAFVIGENNPSHPPPCYAILPWHLAAVASWRIGILMR